MNGRLLSLATGLLLSGALGSCCFFGSHHLPPKPSFHIPGCETMVHRSVAPPSGDWLLHLHYGYSASGRLMHISSTLNTFHAMGANETESQLTTVERIYKVRSSGRLELLKQTIRDAKTNKRVKRGFHDPEVEHWMTLEEAKREKAKQMEIP